MRIAWHEARMADFTFSVLVFGLPMPEYRKDGRVLIESNLFTPVSYKQTTTRLVNGEVHRRECPVTPYQVRVDTASNCPKALFRLYVDGVLVNWNVFGEGKSYVFKGVSGPEGTRELLFALPRFAEGEGDRVEASRVSKLGKIEVVQYATVYNRSEYKRWQGVALPQANMRDVAHLTDYGKHSFATSKEGRQIRSINSYDYYDVWDVGLQVGRRCVEYHMASSLQRMGISVKQVDWSQIPDTALE